MEQSSARGEGSLAEPGPQGVFAQALAHAASCLHGGKIAEALVALEDALAERPDDEQARNLLGLCLFRRGDLWRAEATFRALVEQNPEVASLRINLAMVQLKAHRFAEARVELEYALQLDPEHRRAAAFLALSLEQLGQFREAARWYEKAGQPERAAELKAKGDALASLMSAGLLKAVREDRDASSRQDRRIPPRGRDLERDQEPSAPQKWAPRALTPTELEQVARQQPVQSASPPADPPATPTGSEMPPADVLAVSPADASPPQDPSLDDVPIPPPLDLTLEGEPLMTFEADESGSGSAFDGPSLFPFDLSSEMDLPALAPPPAAEGGPGDDRAQPAALPEAPASAPPPEATSPTPMPRPALDLSADAKTLASFLESHLDADPEAPGATLLPEGGLRLVIAERTQVRSDWLTALWGTLETEPVFRAYQGETTEALFGGERTPMVTVFGRGTAILKPADAHLTLLRLQQEVLFVTEHAVAAFGAGLAWENGRLPDEPGADLDLVQLQGSGFLALASPEPLRVVPVEEGGSATLPVGRLVGWSGSLTPGWYSPSGSGWPGAPLIRFRGTGHVLTYG